MKSIFLTITFVFGALALSAQSDKLVKVLIHKAQLEYLTSNIGELQNSVAVVQDAYQRSDNNTIGATKGDIIKIVHQAPSILSNFSSMAMATAMNEDAAGQRHGLPYKDYAAKINQNGDYVELELMQEEVDMLAVLVTSIKDKKYRLKETGYAIHESQKEKGSDKNLDMLAELTNQLNEAIEILKIGKHR